MSKKEWDSNNPKPLIEPWQAGWLVSTPGMPSPLNEVNLLALAGFQKSISQKLGPLTATK
jgi:hypothetical protein